jgi:hypothetical protein
MENPDGGTERHHMENPDGAPQKRNKRKQKTKAKNRMTQNMEEKNRGTHVWRGVEENANNFFKCEKNMYSQ